MTLDDLLRLLPNARKSGKEYKDFCPVHELPGLKHKTRSLEFHEDKNKKLILVNCRSGNCGTRAICKALGIEPRDLHTDSQNKRRMVKTYPYHDAEGRLLFEKVRYEPKAFYLRSPDGKGGWNWNLNGTRPVLFRLPQLLAKPDELVFIPEGEKDAEFLESLGLLSTTNFEGAGRGKWKQEYSETLRGRNTVICADTDEKGLQFAEEKAQSLYLIAATTKILRPPAPFKDVADWHPSIDQILAALDTIPDWRDSSNAEESNTWIELFDTRKQFDDAPPLTFAIDGFLQSEAINALAALSGNGKTWVALSLTGALLYGPGKLWDYFTVPKRFDRVVYLIPESMRGPIKERLKLMNLYDEIGKRLFMRTLNMGKAPALDDPRLLLAVKNAAVILDTGVRFMQVTDESSAMEIAKGLSEDMMGLLRAGADHVIPLFHSPKSFQKETSMTLEGMIRGSSELGAVLATAWGLKQIDRAANIIHVENLKPRDFEPCGPFQIIGRPYIDKTGDFALFKKPGDCGNLAEEQPELNPRNYQKHDEKTRRIATVRAWLVQDPNMSSKDIIGKFRQLGVENITESTIKKYRMLAARQDDL